MKFTVKPKSLEALGYSPGTFVDCDGRSHEGLWNPDRNHFVSNYWHQKCLEDAIKVALMWLNCRSEREWIRNNFRYEEATW